MPLHGLEKHAQLRRKETVSSIARRNTPLSFKSMRHLPRIKAKPAGGS
jgi:hypothetical protein